MTEGKNEQIRRYVEANPLLSNSQLADIILRDYPDIYKRATLRSQIDKERKRLRIEPIQPELPTETDNPFGLPPAFEIEYEPYIIPERCKKILILSDVHLPYQDNNAITAALEYGYKAGIDCILLNGDIMDWYKASRFTQKPEMPDLGSEVRTARAFMIALRKHFPAAEIIYKLGNHDERLEHFAISKAPELLSLNVFDMSELLDLTKCRINIVEEQRIVYAGKLPIYHGHEFIGGGSGGVNPARALMLKLLTSGVCGHFHKTSEHSEKKGDGKLITTWSLGCLCNMHPEYARNNKWNQGFGLVTIDGGGYHFENKRIQKGVVL